MQNLGSLAVIINKCVMCDKRTPANYDGLFFCSIECWIKYKELSKEIDASYGWTD
jgi:hypothetical protein